MTKNTKISQCHQVFFVSYFLVVFVFVFVIFFFINFLLLDGAYQRQLIMVIHQQQQQQQMQENYTVILRISHNALLNKNKKITNIVHCIEYFVFLFSIIVIVVIVFFDIFFVFFNRSLIIMTYRKKRIHPIVLLQIIRIIKKTTYIFGTFKNNKWHDIWGI